MNIIITEPEISHERFFNKHDIPKSIGAYVITHNINNSHIERYVGSTNDIYHRINSHCDKEILYIDVYVTNDILTALSLERILMNLIKPATNIRMIELLEMDDYLKNKLIKNDEIKEYINNDNIKIGRSYLKKVLKIKRSSGGCAVPLYTEEFNLVKQKQAEIIGKIGKNITLTEVASDIIREGLEFINLKESLELQELI